MYHKYVKKAVFLMIFIGIFTFFFLFSALSTPLFNSLNDSTVYNPNTNICTGYNNKMRVNIYPCVAKTMGGKNIRQIVNFTWYGNTAQKVTWIFAFDNKIKSGEIQILKNLSYNTHESYEDDKWINNKVIDNVVSFVDLGTPTSLCELGNIHNTKMYNVTRDLNNSLFNTSKIYCFTSANQINETTWELSGNITVTKYRAVVKYKMTWDKVSSSVEYLGYNLLDKNLSYYRVSNVTFNPRQSYYTRWVFTPKNNVKSGKWHIFGYKADMSIRQAVQENKYIYFDPSWLDSFNEGLIQYYKLDDLTGDSLNSVNPSLYNLTVTGMNRGETGIQNNSFNFTNANNDYLKNGTQHHFNESITINLWVNASEWNPSAVASQVINKFEQPPSSFQLRMDGGSGKLQWGVATNIDTKTIVYTLPPVKEWYMITARYNGTEIALYYNGTRVSNVSLTGNIVNSTNALSIGATNDATPSNFFQGLMDEIAIYNRSLSPDEISDLYNNGLGLTYQPNTNPDVTINFPVNNEIYKSTDLPLNFNITLDENGTAMYSLDAGVNNITMFHNVLRTGSLFNATNNSLKSQNYTINFYTNDTSGKMNNSESVAFVYDALAPNLSINSPLNNTSQTSTTIEISINASDNHVLSYCYFNITRGASLEVANTQLTTCDNANATVSSVADYMVNIFINDSAGNQNKTSLNITISASASSTPTTSSGGSGGATITETLLAPIKRIGSICEDFKPTYEKTLENAKKEGFDLNSLIQFLRALYDLIICRSASSIVPI